MNTRFESTAVDSARVSGRFHAARLLIGLILVALPHSALAIPVIDSVTPNRGPVGSIVVIAGAGFGATPAENIVFFGTIRAEVTAASATSLNARVPLAATCQPIFVNHDGLIASSPQPFVPTFFSTHQLSTNTFSPPLALPSLPSPHGVLGDLDGDGKLDIIFANYHGGSLSILRNHNIGTDPSPSSFDPRIDFATGPGPQSLTVGDADGDGKIDVVVPNDFGANVSVYRNLSSPGSLSTSSLAEPVHFAAGTHPVAVKLADIDGDGRLDLVVANAVIGPSTVSVHRNISIPGTINADSFAPGVHFPTDNHSFRLAVGDLDGDGKPEVVVANVDTTILSILHNTSVPGEITAASFAPTISLALPMRPYDVELADLDGDGKLDIAANGGTSVTVVLRNLAEPGVLTASSFALPLQLPRGGTEIKIVDLDGDGQPDIAVCGASAAGRTISLYANRSEPGTLAFDPPVTIPSGGERFDVGDLNGDGTPDFVTGRDQIAGSGMFIIQNAISQPDTDGDGLSDQAELLVYHTDPFKRDTDGDGLSDRAEVLIYHTDPLRTDTDEDGFNDSAEVYTGKDPLDRNAFPDAVLTAFPALEVEFVSRSATTYQVQVSSDLKTWSNFAEPIPGTGDVIRKLYSVRGTTARFHRVEIVPGP